MTLRGDGALQTSTGANDVLAWGTDECGAWHTPLDYTSKRPVAWTCIHGGEKVWTTGKTGTGQTDPIDVLLLDGATGDRADHRGRGLRRPALRRLWRRSRRRRQLLRGPHRDLRGKSMARVDAVDFSVDPEGHVWAVNRTPRVAYRIDPAARKMDSYSNLTRPYTYSDMTGWGIQNSTDCQPPRHGRELEPPSNRGAEDEIASFLRHCFRLARLLGRLQRRTVRL